MFAEESDQIHIREGGKSRESILYEHEILLFDKGSLNFTTKDILLVSLSIEHLEPKTIILISVH